MKLTPHFTIEELRCKCRQCDVGTLPEHYDADLLDWLERTRAAYGAPIFISSGARCPEHNEKEGGERNSAHLPLTHGSDTHPQWGKVRAVDAACIGSRNRYNLIEAALKAGFRRIGIARTFIHLDTAFGGPYGQDVIWLYS